MYTVKQLAKISGSQCKSLHDLKSNGRPDAFLGGKEGGHAGSLCPRMCGVEDVDQRAGDEAGFIETVMIGPADPFSSPITLSPFP
jgi:hypothetical protein